MLRQAPLPCCFKYWKARTPKHPTPALPFDRKGEHNTLRLYAYAAAPPAMIYTPVVSSDVKRAFFFPAISFLPQSEHDALRSYAKAVAEGRREPMPELWPPVIRELITSLWAAEPSQRPSAAEAATMLAAAAADVGVLEALADHEEYVRSMVRDATTGCECTIC